MSLKALEISAFRAKDATYRKADEKGLYLEIFPNGSKLWRLKYRIAGKEKRLALGAWPEISLAKARIARDDARTQIGEGIDPALERKKGKAVAKISAANTFDAIGSEYIERKMIGEGKAPATILKTRWFLELLNPAIGLLPVTDVDPQMLLAAIKRLEAKGNYETAKRCRSFASRVFRYAIVTGRAKVDPAAVLQGALVTKKAKHYAAILEPQKLGQLLRSIEIYDGNPITRFALQIAPHVFVRPGESRHAEWAEFDLEAAIWNIPAGKMKARRAHSVPLTSQVIALIRDLSKVTGQERYLFPSTYTPARPMSENTVNVALRRMGYTKDEMTAHGFRASASTLLNESGLWNPDAIERALAHGDSSATRGSYSRGVYWEERVKMAQWWSNYLDKLRTGGEVIGFPAANRATPE